jgi:NhaP-type Na+/H+ and K+/H+ antiporter
MQYQLAKHRKAFIYAILWWCCGLKNSPTSFRVLSFWQSLVMVTFGVFVFSLMKGINNGVLVFYEVF